MVRLHRIILGTQRFKLQLLCFSTYAKTDQITIYSYTRKTKNSYRKSGVYLRRLKFCEKICGNLGLYLHALIPYGWQENDMEYVELLIICIKIWWRPLNFPEQHTDRWKAYSVLVSEKMITRLEANKVPQQDCALSLNRQTPEFTMPSNTIMKCSYHKKGTQVSEFSDESQVRSYIR